MGITEVEADVEEVDTKTMKLTHDAAGDYIFSDRCPCPRVSLVIHPNGAVAPVDTHEIHTAKFGCATVDGIVVHIDAFPTISKEIGPAEPTCVLLMEVPPSTLMVDLTVTPEIVHKPAQVPNTMKKAEVEKSAAERTDVAEKKAIVMKNAKKSITEKVTKEKTTVRETAVVSTGKVVHTAAGGNVIPNDGPYPDLNPIIHENEAVVYVDTQDENLLNQHF